MYNLNWPSIRRTCLALLFTAITVSTLYAEEPSSDLLGRGFVEPPLSARPRVFWLWMQTKYHNADLTRDLEEMKRIGIGGALIWDNGHLPHEPIPSGPLYMGSEWREKLTYAIREADRLGIEISLNLSSGACCGGPWIPPAYAAARMIWREKEVQGPLELSEKLPIPEGTIKDEKGLPIFYRDIVVLALRLSDQAKAVPPIKNWGKKSLAELHEHRTLDDYQRGKLFGHAPEVPGEFHVASDTIRDISEYMDMNGHLRWNVPEGKWLIVRFGHTHTGSPVSGGPKPYDASTNGLDLDHLSRKAMDLHFEGMAKKLIEDAGDLAGKTLKYFHCDSVETGRVNWSGEFRAEFKKRRGYDLFPFFPVLTGKIVDGREKSNRFLYDF